MISGFLLFQERKQACVKHVHRSRSITNVYDAGDVDLARTYMPISIDIIFLKKEKGEGGSECSLYVP